MLVRHIVMFFMRMDKRFPFEERVESWYASYKLKWRLAMNIWNCHRLQIFFEECSGDVLMGEICGNILCVIEHVDYKLILHVC